MFRSGLITKAVTCLYGKGGVIKKHCDVKPLRRHKNISEWVASPPELGEFHSVVTERLTGGFINCLK
jgi:hypothetical protein